MVINTDKITTASHLVSGTAGLLAANGIYPQYTGFLFAMASFISGYFTNKPNSGT